MIRISKILYKNAEPKIKLHFPIEKTEIQAIRSRIAETKYSQTHRCWYLPYNKESFDKLKELYSNIKIIANKEQQVSKKKCTINIDKENKKIYLKLNTTADLFYEIKKIEKSYYNKEKKEWLIKGTNENYLTLKTLLKHFGYEIKIQYTKEKFESQENPVLKTTLIYTRVSEKRISQIKNPLDTIITQNKNSPP